MGEIASIRDLKEFKKFFTEFQHRKKANNKNNFKNKNAGWLTVIDDKYPKKFCLIIFLLFYLLMFLIDLTLNISNFFKF